MISYMKKHQRYIEEMLDKNLNKEELKDLLDYHDKQIRWMQHERLVHLIVMLFVCLFTLLLFGFTILNPTLPCFALSALLVVLAVAYIIHYYRIENSVQKWYDLSNRIQSTRRS